MLARKTTEGDVCEKAAQREQLELLRASGFGRLLELIGSDPGRGNPDPSVFSSSGKLNIDKLRKALGGISRAAVTALLNDARGLLEGKFQWEVLKIKTDRRDNACGMLPQDDAEEISTAKGAKSAKVGGENPIANLKGKSR